MKESAMATWFNSIIEVARGFQSNKAFLIFKLASSTSAFTDGTIAIEFKTVVPCTTPKVLKITVSTPAEINLRPKFSPSSLSGSASATKIKVLGKPFRSSLVASTGLARMSVRVEASGVYSSIIWR